MEPRRGRYPGLAALVALAVAVFVVGLVVVDLAARKQLRVTQPPVEAAAIPVEAPRMHVVVPTLLKGLYLTSGTAGSARFADMIAVADRTEINAFVIDMKDDNGAPAFHIANPDYADVNRAKSTIRDLAAVAKEAHDHGIYLIARIPVFQDSWFADRRPQFAMKRPGGALWTDKRGIRWLDPAAEGVWDYDATIAEEASAAGFDEIQVDYVRFASDGDVSQIVYPAWDKKEGKPEVLARFFSTLAARLHGKGIPLSADLFGYTFRIEDGYDLNIGQRLALTLPSVDFVSPMVYPSHYEHGHLGFPNPAEHPGEVVDDALKKGQTIIDAVRPDFHGVRPWLQDFNLGAVYTPEMVRAQIDAAEKDGAEGWLLWNARNVYTEDALKKT